MLVVSLSGVIFRFWSHFGCSGQNAIYLAVKVSFRVKTTYGYLKVFGDNVFDIIKSRCIIYLSMF